MRNLRWTVFGFCLRNSHMNASISKKARVKPANGEITIGISTLSTIVCQCTVAPAAMAAPPSPPMSACDDDDGRPSHQVVRFQMMAPSRPHITMVRPCSGAKPSVLMVSLTVWATFCPSRPPTKFITAAMMSATRGVRARVDTEVAIALAASWKPLV